MPAIVAMAQVVEDLLVQFGDFFPNEPARRHFANRGEPTAVRYSLLPYPSAQAAAKSRAARVCRRHSVPRSGFFLGSRSILGTSLPQAQHNEVPKIDAARPIEKPKLFVVAGALRQTPLAGRASLARPRLRFWLSSACAARSAWDATAFSGRPWKRFVVLWELP
jgi:hypothetical protein